MEKFEYKVHLMSGLTESRTRTIGADTVEDAINRYAADGWEYQNTIVNPCEYPFFYIVFRRVKK